MYRWPVRASDWHTGRSRARARVSEAHRMVGRPVRAVVAMIGSEAMSTLVPASPAVACRDHELMLTKRRPIDFGLVAACLCRPF